MPAPDLRPDPRAAAARRARVGGNRRHRAGRASHRAPRGDSHRRLGGIPGLHRRRRSASQGRPSARSSGSERSPPLHRRPGSAMLAASGTRRSSSRVGSAGPTRTLPELRHGSCGPRGRSCTNTRDIRRSRGPTSSDGCSCTSWQPSPWCFSPSASGWRATPTSKASPGAMPFSTPPCCSAAWGRSRLPARTAASCSPAATRSMRACVFLVAIGIVLAPIVHRVMHRFHWEGDER